MKHRVISVFLALMVVLLSVRVPDVDADEDAPVQFTIDRNGHVVRFNCYQSDLDIVNELKENNYPYGYDNGKSVDAYTALMAEAQNRDIFEGSSPSDIFPLFCRTYDFGYWFYYLDFTDITDVVDVSFDYYINDGAEYGTFNIYPENLPIKNFYFRNDAGEGINSINYKSDNTSCGGYYDLYFFPFLDDYEVASLRFYYDQQFAVGMDLTTLPQQFTLTATNETDNYYNYVFYISSSPASSGVQKSFSDAVYIMSSNQWCMKYSWSSLMPDDDVSISEWVKDVFGRVIDPWGNIFNPEQSYMGRHGSGSSDDGIYYYTLSQQKKCPFYLIKPNDSRAHVIPYSALNLSLDTTYYANIIYLDTTDYGVVPSSNSWGAADTSHNNYRSHPLYNLNLISRFAVYSSTEFSFVNGNFTKDDDGLYDYKDVVDNSNPGASSATISSEDNSVSINNANSYDNSSSVSYINYGTIYHNCTWGSSGVGGSGSSIVAPTVPEFDFDQLIEGCGNFLEFVKHVFFECMPEIFTVMLIAAFAVVIYCRVWGR